jgi:hypothetical protein
MKRHTTASSARKRLPYSQILGATKPLSTVLVSQDSTVPFQVAHQASSARITYVNTSAPTITHLLAFRTLNQRSGTLVTDPQMTKPTSLYPPTELDLMPMTCLESSAHTSSFPKKRLKRRVLLVVIAKRPLRKSKNRSWTPQCPYSRHLRRTSTPHCPSRSVRKRLKMISGRRSLRKTIRDTNTHRCVVRTVAMYTMAYTVGVI